MQTQAPQRFIVSSTDAARLARLRAEMLAKDPDAKVVHELPIIDAIAVEVQDAGALRRLSFASGAQVQPDREITVPDLPAEPPGGPLELETSTNALGLPELWRKGITGKGVGIAVIDSGIAAHPDLSTHVIAFKDIEHHVDTPHDEFGHGTHVSSIAAGSGKASSGRYAGCAPDADLIGVRVMDARGHGNVSDVIAGIQWTVDNKDAFHIRVMNMSIGQPIDNYAADDPVVKAVEAAAAKGIVPCISAGNDGPGPMTVSSPGNAPSAITVGALDTHGTVYHGDDTVAKFSSRGPTNFDAFAKPDLVAPGVSITAASNKGGYVSHSGTSMASPMVAGCVALVLQARPDLTPAQVKALLVRTADVLPNVDPSTQGAGVINPGKAIAAQAE